MKKVLFVSYDFPYPTNTGGKNRAFNLIKYGSKNIEIHLASFIREDFRKDYEDKLRKINVKTITLFKRRKLIDIRNIKSLFLKKNSIFRCLYYNSQTEDSLLELIKSFKIDIVHFESYYTAFYVSDKIRNLRAKQIFGTENIEYFLYKDYNQNSNWLKRIIIDREVKKIEQEEKELLKSSDKNIAVTKEEANFIKSVTGRECEVVPNGVDLEEFRYNSPSEKIKNTLLFIGNFTYFPNIDAINYFYNKVFKRLDSDIKLLVVGKNAQKLSLAKDKRVKAISFLKDIKDAYNMADIMISPVRIGGGTNFKVLETMAYGIPIIADPSRVKSLKVKDGYEMLLAETALEYKQKIVLLLRDFGLRKQLSKNARKLVERDYSWKTIGERLNFIWRST